MLFSRSKLIATHNGSFHADDIFACATLCYFLDQKKEKYQIKRTRDQEIINKADYVVDVGAIYDAERFRFDHHQSGGAGLRENGIPYASFGLVWKHFGERLCKSKDIADEIDHKLVQPIDAVDNGVSISEAGDCGLRDYGIHGIVAAYQCTWKQAGEHREQDKRFFELVMFFKVLIAREIEQSTHRLEMVTIIQKAYDQADRKDIVEIPYHAGISPLMQVFELHPETMFVVTRSNANWKALALRKEPCSFESRICFPKSWAGKRNEDFEELTGVSGAIFCHNALFMAVADSKQGAWQLAEQALAEHNREHSNELSMTR